MPLSGVFRRVGLAVLLAGSATVSRPASATMAQALTLADMVHEADDVVIADVVSAAAAWDARHETIVTTVELSVVEAWKGATTPRQRLTVQQPGGTVGDVTMTVSGLSSFTPGERALLFLRDTGKPAPGARASDGAAAATARHLAVVGLAQGKRGMEPVSDPAKASGAQWMVRPPVLSGLARVPRTTLPGAALSSALPAQPEPEDLRPVSLEAMKARVRTLLGSEKK